MVSEVSVHHDGHGRVEQFISWHLRSRERETETRDKI
jgi:hypothetical protein